MLLSLSVPIGLHAAGPTNHRSNLLRKDFKHYSRRGWQESTDLSYLWPITKETS